MTVFEFPLNEKVRAYLRADELLQRLVSLIEGESPLEHHFAIQTLFELQDMANRSDIKGDLIRDLDRQRQGLAGLRGNPDIQEQRLEATLANFNARHEALSKMAGKPGQQLNELDWLNALRGRMSIPAGTCAFDLPAYHHWGQQPCEVRQRELHALLLHFAPLQRAIGLLLDVLRQSGEPRAVVANGGQLQYSVAPGRVVQLLRLDARHEQQLVPEISANRLAIVIRWMEVDHSHRLSPCKRDVNFELSLCS